MSLEEQNTAVLKAVMQSWNDGTFLQASAKLIAPGFVRHDLAEVFPNVSGIRGVVDSNRMLSTSFAELHLEPVQFVAAGDRVCVHFVGSGVHRGELLGIPPTGQKVTWHGINIYRLANGQIVETWQLADNLGLLRQIGAVTLAEQVTL
jgi:predicted ester cyclase